MEYHVGRDQQQLGKFTEQQLREGLFDGRFLKTDLLWHEGMDGWKPLADVLSSDAPPPPEAPLSLEPAVPSTPPVSSIPTAPLFTPPPSPYVTPAGFGGPGPAMANARPTSGTAIASLILGIASLPGVICYGIGLFISIAGIICGHLSLSAIKRSNQTLDGKGLAIGGLVLSYITLVLSALFIAFFAFLFATEIRETKLEPTPTPAEFPATSTPPGE